MPLELQVRLLRVLETGSVVARRRRATRSRSTSASSPPPTATPTRPSRGQAARGPALPPRRVPDPPAAAARARRATSSCSPSTSSPSSTRRSGGDKRFTRDALARLRRHGWPGNVRELKNAVQRAFILADDEIEAEHLPLRADARRRSAGPMRPCASRRHVGRRGRAPADPGDARRCRAATRSAPRGRSGSA